MTIRLVWFWILGFLISCQSNPNATQVTFTEEEITFVDSLIWEDPQPEFFPIEPTANYDYARQAGFYYHPGYTLGYKETYSPRVRFIYAGMLLADARLSAVYKQSWLAQQTFRQLDTTLKSIHLPAPTIQIEDSDAYLIHKIVAYEHQIKDQLQIENRPDGIFLLNLGKWLESLYHLTQFSQQMDSSGIDTKVAEQKITLRQILEVSKQFPALRDTLQKIDKVPFLFLYLQDLAFTMNFCRVDYLQDSSFAPYGNYSQRLRINQKSYAIIDKQTLEWIRKKSEALRSYLF
ncbi:MAG: hypothetical protein NZ108_02955 [Bacteroidia bacterium]|nr:hypothetical protein [Bacteroidia bacterium]